MALDGWENFLKLCLSAKNDKILNEILTMFLTPEEKESLAGRTLIVESLLQQNSSQRKMAEELHVSIAKITRGSNELKRISPELTAFLKKFFK